MIWLRWYGRQALAMLGNAGVIGIGLIIAVAIFCVSVLAPLHQHVSDLKAEASSPHSRDLAQMKAAQDPSAQLEKFNKFFSNGATLTDELARLYEIGDKHGLALKRADYKATEDPDLKLTEFHVSLPMTATYPQLKQFVNAVLTEIPTVSLDQFTVQRHAVGDATVDAQLQFTMYLPNKS